MTAQHDLEPTTPPPARKASTRRRVIKWALVTFGVLAMAFVALVAFVMIEFSGGFKWVFTIAPEASDKNVVEADSAGNAPRDTLVSAVRDASAAVCLVGVPHGGAQARAEALTYLRGQRDRYIVITKVTYQTFNQ